MIEQLKITVCKGLNDFRYDFDKVALINKAKLEENTGLKEK